MTFSGRASYDTGVFEGVAEDVSDLITMISPYETPLLDVLGDPNQPAQNVFHEWLEDALNPNAIMANVTLIPSTNTAAVGVVDLSGNPVTQYLQPGIVLHNGRSGEYLQISVIAGNTITVIRAFAGTTISTIASGDQLFLVSDASLEGADVARDISRPRVRLNNYCQIFKKDIIISGTELAQRHLGNVQNEWDYQVDKRVRESLRDLEKAVIRGRLSGNSLGSATAYRTFDGVWSRITTNVTSLASPLTPDVLNDTIIRGAWDQGAQDLDWIVCDANMKQRIDKFNSTRLRVNQGESSEQPKYFEHVTQFESTYGLLNVMLNRWMPSNSLMVISSRRIKVLPLAGRSYRTEQVAKTGDSTKGMVIGEYTLELRNEYGMAKAYLG